MSEQETINIINKAIGEGSKIIQPISGGMMNLSYLVESKNKNQYILYISTDQANEMVDRALEKEHQSIIYNLGITSKNVYFDVEKGIKINEFIPGNSLDKVSEFNYQKVADLLKKLHNSVLLSRNDYAPFVRFTESYEKEAKQYETEINDRYEMLRDFLFGYRSFLESQMLCLCHNDSQRSNIIKTPDDNYYLIDFEFVGNNDPIYDIAAFGNGKVSEGRELLNCYYSNKPTTNQIKRYYLWRIFISLQWYNVAITKHYRGEGKSHNYNFLEVANHFLLNAKDAYDGFMMEIKEESEQSTEKLIISTLDKIRHFLQKDGGDCEFVSYKDGIVYVKMKGACQDCSFAGADIKELVEVVLQEEVPGVIEVRMA